MTALIGRVRETFPWRFGNDILALTLVCWLGFVAVVALIEISVAIWGSIDESLWSHLSQIAAWYVLFIGGYITYVLLPMHVANGQTRREFATQIALFLPAFTVFSAALMTAGYGLERILYRLNDWPQAVASTHIYSAPTDYGLIFLEFALTYLVWSAAGALGGAGWYRSVRAGIGTTIAGVLLIAVASTALSRELGPVGPLIESLGADRGELPLALATPICLATFAATLAILWVAVRDIPIQSKSP